MSSNRPPVAGAELWGPPHLTERDVVRRRQAKELAERQKLAPVIPRKIWRDPSMAKACWLSGCGYTNAEIARMVGSTEGRIGALLRGLGLRSRNIDGNRLLSHLVPKHVFAVIADAAGDVGLSPGAYAAGAAVGQALRGQPDPALPIKMIIAGAEPPEVADYPGPLLGSSDLPADQAAAIDAAVMRRFFPATAKVEGRAARTEKAPKGRA
jgi:hypothetical protein